MRWKTTKILAAVLIPAIGGFAIAQVRDGHHTWVWEFLSALGVLYAIGAIIWLEENIR